MLECFLHEMGWNVYFQKRNFCGMRPLSVTQCQVKHLEFLMKNISFRESLVSIAMYDAEVEAISKGR